MISAGFAAAGSRRPGVSFEPAAPTQLSSCLCESWEAVSARKELQIEAVLNVFDQELAKLCNKVDINFSIACLIMIQQFFDQDMKYYSHQHDQLLAA